MRKIKLGYSRGDFKLRDKQYLELLKRLNLFWQLIGEVRADIDVKEFFSSYPNKTTFAKSQNHSHKIIDFFELPSSWLHPLSDFIVMDKFYSPGQSISLLGDARKVDSATFEVDKRSPDLHIIIKQKMSVESLLDWIELNRVAIRKRLNQLPKKNTLVGSRFQIKCRILELREQGVMPEEISNKLLVEYPDENISNVDVSQLLDQVKQVIKRRGK